MKKYRLNPLSIGSVFPTIIDVESNLDGRLNPLSIGSVFPTAPSKFPLPIQGLETGLPVFLQWHEGVS